MSTKKQVTEEEPVSPFAQLFSLPGLDVFNIVTIGCKTDGDASTIIEGLKNTLINHPRFSSILVTGHGEGKGKAKWIPTKVKVEDHVMGCLMSLMSLLLACTRKICDPEALPTFVDPKKSKAKNARWSLVAWLLFLVRTMFHTCVEVCKALTFICFSGGPEKHITCKPGATLSTNKFIHKIIPLDDVKNVKNAMNMTVNDVLFGMAQAGLSRYLNQRYDLETTSDTRKALDKICHHGVVFFNLRPNRDIEDLANMMAKGSKCRWGNSLGYVLIPLWLKSENDILEYVRQAKTTMDRKKLSLEPLFSYGLLKLTMEVFGITVRSKSTLSYISKYNIFIIIFESNQYMFDCTGGNRQSKAF
ncbi:Diacylglycerol O-acyltransferase [Hirschfeldia incana]|nr:Diacylglycerol O-acyltransferase [Hirschfeldia incana]